MTVFKGTWQNKYLFHLPLNHFMFILGSSDGAVVGALASHQCGPGSLFFLPPKKTTFQIPIRPG